MVQRPAAFKSIFAGVVTLAAIAGTGCATVANGFHQDLAVRSEPLKAQIYVNGKWRGETPAVVSLRRRQSVVLRLERDGFEPFETRIPRRVSKWALGSLACLNPFAAQGLDSASQWPVMIAACLAQSLGFELLLGGGFTFDDLPTVTLVPSSPEGEEPTIDSP